MLELKELKDKAKQFKSILSKFKNDGLSVHPLKDNKRIKKLEKRWGMKLHPELKELYTSSSSFRIGWEGLYDDYKVHGYCTLRTLSILDSLGLGNDRFLDLSKIEEDSINTERLYLFDSINLSGNYVLVYLGEDDPQLFLFTHGYRLHKLNLTVSEYISKLVLYLGISYWQQFYLDHPAQISNYYLWDQRYLKVLEALIPAEDYEHVLEQVGKIENENIIELPKEAIQETLPNRLKALKKSHKIKVGELKLQKNVDPSTLMKASETLGKSLPKGMIELYAQTNGVELEWSKGKSGGSINFAPLEEVFAGEHHYRYDDWTDTGIFKEVVWFGEEDDLDILQRLKPLELFNGSSDFVGFLVNANGEFELYYSFGRNDLIKLPIGLDKYIELSIRLLGLYGWQEYYLKDVDSIEAGVGLMEEIHQFFPDFKEEEFLS